MGPIKNTCETPIELPIKTIENPKKIPAESPGGGKVESKSIDFENASELGTETNAVFLGKATKNSLSSLGGE